MADRPAFFNISLGKTFMSLFLKNERTNDRQGPVYTEVGEVARFGGYPACPHNLSF